MDPLPFHSEVLSMATFILVLLLNTNDALSVAAAEVTDDEEEDDVLPLLDCTGTASQTVSTVLELALQNSRLWNSLSFLDDDLGFWVKPRSTVWFSRFVVEEFDDGRCMEMFRMTKRALFSLANLLAPSIRKKNTKYRRAIPVSIRLACTLFKLCHGASFIICSEMFAVGRSIVSFMLREVVQAINVTLRAEISWPSREQATVIAHDFEGLCALPGVMGAIDCTQIGIAKPANGAADYFYFKSGGYSVNCQAVVDNSKRFLDVYVGMPGATNDARMLRRSTFFTHGQRNSLWDHGLSFHDFSPYLIGDAAYPTLPWIMAPRRRHDALLVADALFNRKLSKGRVVVENAFGLLKLSFRELLQKCDLDVCIVPDVVICCMILHNLLLAQSHDEVERLLEVIRLGEEEPSVEDEDVSAPEGVDIAVDDIVTAAGQRKWRDLGVFLSLQRIVPM